MNTINFKVGGQFEDEGADGFWVGFEILFPCICGPKRCAEVLSDYISAWMVKQENGEVVICLYQFGTAVETIRWDEWWKYKSYRSKKPREIGFTVEREDYEPCSMKFEEIFEGFIGTRNDVTKFELQFLSYWVEPVLSSKKSQF